ncbi:4-(cytidine 5'-diphospho)-2-C-methyl-D-erythritol kinase [soil metagenome]
MSVEIAAYAKLNLALAVSAPEPATAFRRAGWHRICSWFAPIALHDTLTLTARSAGEPSVHAIVWAEDAPRPRPIDWPIEKDLAVRAHRLLEAHAGHPLPLHLHLAKRIPVGGGLGGGSSDAAAMLRGVNALFDLGLRTVDLVRLGATLGSDIAFFLDDNAAADDLETPPRPAIVSGFGESIIRVERFREDVLLLLPEFGCATGDVYQAFDALIAERAQGAEPHVFDETGVWELIEMARADRAIPAAKLFNDLAAAACVVRPELKALLEGALRPTAIPIHMTGSGSTLFVPFDIEDDDEDGSEGEEVEAIDADEGGAINRLADLAEQNEPTLIAIPTSLI